jgi:ATP-dependent Lon protease
MRNTKIYNKIALKPLFLFFSNLFMNYPEKLIVVPLENKVLLPSVVLRLLIRGKQATELTRSYFRQQANNKKPIHDIYVACIPLKPLVSDTAIHEDDACSVSQAPQVPIPYTPSTEIDSQGNLVSLNDRNRLMEYGCLARIVRVQRSGANLFGVFVEGIARFKVTLFSQNTPSVPFPHCWMAHVEYYSSSAMSDNHDTEARFKQLSQVFIAKMRELQLPESLLTQLTKVVNTMPAVSLADFIVSIIETTFEEKLIMLSAPVLEDRLNLASDYLNRQLHVLQISDNIGSGIDAKLSKRQREFYLRQQVSLFYYTYVC